jgi:hypothetical protein
LFLLSACIETSSGGSCPSQLPPYPDGGRPAPGCYADPPGQICDQSTGSCQAACAADQLEVTCIADATGNGPEPDASLGCTVLTLPTPEGVTFYCCPCGA